jgi:hypothetical protein
MAEPLRHRQTKEAATDMFSLQPPRHISTLHEATDTTAMNLRSLLGVLRTWKTCGLVPSRSEMTHSGRLPVDFPAVHNAGLITPSDVVGFGHAI